ncbi:hypothetical protein D3C73_1113360 [compost metagenome]
MAFEVRLLRNTGCCNLQIQHGGHDFGEFGSCQAFRTPEPSVRIPFNNPCRSKECGQRLMLSRYIVEQVPYIDFFHIEQRCQCGNRFVSRNRRIWPEQSVCRCCHVLHFAGIALQAVFRIFNPVFNRDYCVILVRNHLDRHIARDQNLTGIFLAVHSRRAAVRGVIDRLPFRCGQLQLAVSGYFNRRFAIPFGKGGACDCRDGRFFDRWHNGHWSAATAATSTAASAAELPGPGSRQNPAVLFIVCYRYSVNCSCALQHDRAAV